MYDKSSLLESQSTTPRLCSGLLRLFKVVPTVAYFADPNTVSQSEAISLGFVILNPDNTVLQDIPKGLFDLVAQEYGRDGTLFNKTFYGDFVTVAQKSAVELIVDQVLHYLSTYGTDFNAPPYIPASALNLPKTEYNADFQLTVIRLVPKSEYCQLIDNYFRKTVSPPSALMSILGNDLAPLVSINAENIKSFELQCIVHEVRKTVPSNPISLLRYLIYSTTGETLIIKNQYLIEKIKQTASVSGLTAYNILSKCDKAALASIFFRYKPLFLAFKKHEGCSPIINALRRLADEYHKPLPKFSIQNVISNPLFSSRYPILAKATNRELVKVMNAILSALKNESSPKVYNIRNGKIFAKPSSRNTTDHSRQIDIFLQAKEILIGRLAPSLIGKTFYIPSDIQYAVPTTEKQFVGNIPYGSKLMNSPNETFTLGIYWEDQDGNVDIDLHLSSVTAHFGWNGSYIGDGNIIYSGDLTSAPNGAAEAYLYQPHDGVYRLSAHLYSGNKPAKFRLFMTSEEEITTNRTYVYNPNADLFPPIPFSFKETTDATLGILIDGSFYFYSGSLGSYKIPAENQQNFLEGIRIQLETKFLLESLLIECGARVINTRDNLESTISLSPEDLTATTLLDIIDYDEFKF